MDYVRIAVTSDFGVALVIYSLLDSEGISVEDVSNSGHISLAGADQGYYIKVAAEDVPRAVAELKAHDFSRYLLA